MVVVWLIRGVDRGKGMDDLWGAVVGKAAMVAGRGMPEGKRG